MSFYVYVLRDSGTPDENRYIGGAYGNEQRRFAHTATRGAKSNRQWIAEAEAAGRMVVRKILFTCADADEVRWAETAAWDAYKAMGHRVQEDRPNGFCREARQKGLAVLKASGWRCLKKGNETNAANGWREAKKAFAKGRVTMAADGWPNLKKAAMVHAAGGWQNCKKARAVHAADGHPGLIKGRATCAANGYENLKKARASLAEGGHENLKSGRAAIAAHAAADPEFYRRRALKAWETRRARKASA